MHERVLNNLVQTITISTGTPSSLKGIHLTKGEYYTKQQTSPCIKHSSTNTSLHRGMSITKISVALKPLIWRYRDYYPNHLDIRISTETNEMQIAIKTRQ